MRQAELHPHVKIEKHKDTHKKVLPNVLYGVGNQLAEADGEDRQIPAQHPFHEIKGQCVTYISKKPMRLPSSPVDHSSSHFLEGGETNQQLKRCVSS